jgi:glycosyltransferase involved in cell wall biosynthesis
VSSRSFTGPAAAALTDVRALRAAGHDARLASTGGGALERGCAEQGVPFVGGFRLGRGAGRWLHLPADVRRLRAAMRELVADVVHVHRSDEQLLARLAIGRGDKPLVVRTWHRDPAAVPEVLRRRVAASCAGCVCVARAHAESLRAAGARRAEFLPPGVATERFQPKQTAEKTPARLGQIGRWKAGQDRGQLAFLEVLRRLDPKLSWHAVLLGRGEGRAELERLLAAHPARSRVELEETGKDFPAQVAALDLGFVFATGSDGTSRPAVEMLACGVPVLLAALPGLRELGEDDACARVLTAGDHEAWAREAGALIADPARFAESRMAARRRAEAFHALPIRGAALADFYGRLRR